MTTDTDQLRWLDSDVAQAASEAEARKPREVLTGMGACLGDAEGRAFWVLPDKGGKATPDLQERMRSFPRGAILLSHMTSPDLLPVMRRAAGIVTVNGGRTCHAAVVSREWGIPCVVGVGDRLEAVRDGMIIRVKGAEGEVDVL